MHFGVRGDIKDPRLHLNRLLKCGNNTAAQPIQSSITEGLIGVRLAAQGCLGHELKVFISLSQHYHVLYSKQCSSHSVLGENCGPQIYERLAVGAAEESVARACNTEQRLGHTAHRYENSSFPNQNLHGSALHTR